MKMLCLTKYTSRGPSSRYRLLQFRPWLERRGIDIDVQALHDDDYLTRRFAGRRPSPAYLAGRLIRRAAALTRARRYDLVFIQKEIFPYAPGFAEWALVHFGTKLVLDIDDAIFLFYRRRRFLRNKFASVVSRCALVLAGNNYLRETTARYTDRVVLFPTVVDSERFTPTASRHDGEPVVGWIGSPATS
ncbi:MAG: glycosyltransferase family 1 protein, partial [Candidatus Krumholzibacteriota bacterium]|nr:glycosyltransferase family 1 protein [Candidatus Krumholzibacteriota bacterium]